MTVTQMWSNLSCTEQTVAVAAALLLVMLVRYALLMLYNRAINAPPLITGFFPFLVRDSLG